MKYFAMIDGERKGPFTLDELATAGVTPQTYVWSKDMKDWEKAEEVADICRYFRQRIAAIQHPGTVVAPDGTPDPAVDNRDSDIPDDGLTEEQRKRLEEIPIAFREMVRKSGKIPTEAPNDPTNINEPPNSMMWLAVMSTILCFPLTGFIAIYYSFRTRALWNEAMKNDGVKDSKETKELAHDAARKARLWTGITISLGIMVFGFYIGARG